MTDYLLTKQQREVKAELEELRNRLAGIRKTYAELEVVARTIRNA